MAVSIVERILANWYAALLLISKDNGYENNIDRVERFHLGVMDQEKNIIIQTKHGGVVVQEDQPYDVDSRILTISDVLLLRHDHETDLLSTDTIMNSLEQDHYKAVMTDRTRGGLARDTRFLSASAIELSEDGSRAERSLSYEVVYRHLLGDMTTN